MSVHTGSPKGGDAHGDGVPIVLKGSGECLRQEEGEQGRRPSFQKMARNAPGILWEQAGSWRDTVLVVKRQIGQQEQQSGHGKSTMPRRSVKAKPLRGHCVSLDRPALAWSGRIRPD